MFIKSVIFPVIFSIATPQPGYARDRCETDFLNLVMPHTREWSGVPYDYRSPEGEDHLGIDFEEHSSQTGEYLVRVYNEVTDSDGMRESNMFFIRINTRRKFVGMVDIETGKIAYLLDVDKNLYRNYVRKCLD